MSVGHTEVEIILKAILQHSESGGFTDPLVVARALRLTLATWQCLVEVDELLSEVTALVVDLVDTRNVRPTVH